MTRRQNVLYIPGSILCSSILETSPRHSISGSGGHETQQNHQTYHRRCRLICPTWYQTQNRQLRCSECRIGSTPLLPPKQRSGHSSSSARRPPYPVHTGTSGGARPHHYGPRELLPSSEGETNGKRSYTCVRRGGRARGPAVPLHSPTSSDERGRRRACKSHQSDVARGGARPRMGRGGSR